MTSMRILTLVALAGCAADETGVTIDTVERRQPTITSVTTDDGFTQIRQSATVSIVIRGKKLGGATSVTVGGLFVQIDSVAAHQIHATVSAFGARPGPLDVTVTSPRGTAVAAGALEVTPFVVSPTAAAGHGTFQSPMNLCDPDMNLLGVGTTAQLLAGTHHCDHAIEIGAGAVLAGDPTQPTILTGTATGGFGITILFGDDLDTTTIRDVAFAAPLAAVSIDLGAGGLVVQRVVDAGGIQQFGNGFATLDHYSYEGEGNAIELLNGAIKNSSVRHCGAGDAIRVATTHSSEFGNGITLDGVVVEDCARGVVVGQLPGVPESVGAAVRTSQFVGGGIAIANLTGNSFVADTAIAGGRTGIFVNSGNLTVSRVQITGAADAGISIQQRSSAGHDAQLFADHVTIVGGRLGIEFEGIDNNLSLHDSTVRDQTQAALLISSLDSFVDLGTTGHPGNNALSVVSGFAILDDRQGTDVFDQFIQAVGTTLNGVSFTGQTIEGPAELAPHYRVVFDGGIQF